MPRLVFASPTLDVEYQSLVLLRQSGDISNDAFVAQRTKLIRKQAGLNKRSEAARERRRLAAVAAAEAAQRARQAEFLRKQALKKERAAVAALMRRTKPVARGVMPESGYDNIDFLREMYDRLAVGGSYRVIVSGANNWEREIVIATFRQFVNVFLPYPIELVDKGDRILIFAPNNIPAARLRQMFRDGIEHCVFKPILSKLEATVCKSKDQMKKNLQRVAKLKELEALYSEGVPEDKMEEVARASGFKIMIHDIFGKVVHEFNGLGKKGVLKFTNTRPNHIDLGQVVLGQDYSIVTSKELCKIWKTADREREFYMIGGDISAGIPRKLQFIDRAYKVRDPNEEYFERMDLLADIKNCKLNAMKYPEVNEFIKEGRIINAWPTPLSDLKPTGHLDMPKAYTQFKKCSMYMGFMGVIHQWRTGEFDLDFVREHIGIYRFKVLRNPDVLSDRLGIGSVHILPSPEILYLASYGVEMVIDKGVWGSKMDFEFSDEMLEDRRYCLWSGRLSCESKHDSFSFKCGDTWAGHIASEYGKDSFYWKDRGICTVKIPKKNVYTTHHILAFITSYVRIQMMEAMRKFKIEQICRVVMDGIYFTGERPMGLEWFREKEIKESAYKGFAWYSASDLVPCNFPIMKISKNALLTGQGGSGKTYGIMTDTGYNNTLFVTPQHILGTDAVNKYSCKYTTINKLVGFECQSYLTDHAYPPVLFIDEVTQIPREWIDKVFEMYPKSLIILAGDLIGSGQWFQCRNGTPGAFSKIWKPSGVEIIEIEGDRRSRDSSLASLKIQIRDFMKRCFVDGDTDEEEYMKMWAKKYLSLVTFDTACSMFSSGDVWIAGTHRTSQRLLGKGVVSGWYKKGGHIATCETAGYEKRGSFTIHSFQGRTLETGKIFISIGDLFEYSMLYTAVSRAVHYDQLVFVN